MNDEQAISCAQYITWAMAIVGWIITMAVAWAVLRKNARNTWTGDIKKVLIELEDESVSFWMGDNSDMDLLDLKKLRRKIKEITALAMEIKDYGGPNYPKDKFIQLRRSVTTEKYHQDQSDVLDRKLLPNDNRITEISDVCSDLRALYKRDKKMFF